MIAFRLLLALVLGLAGLSAHAGYAQATPPAGWGGSPGAWTFAAANDAHWTGSTVRTNATLNVGGRAVTLNAAMRMAANAPRFAAAAAFFLPPLRFGMGLAAWAAAAAILWDEANQRWAYRDTATLETSDGFSYRGQDGTIYGSPSGCSAALSKYYAYVGNIQIINVSWHWGGGAYVTCVGDIQYPNGAISPKNSTVLDKIPNGQCPAGWYITPAGCVQNPPLKPLSKEEFERRITAVPMPDSVPSELPPGTPLPVELPTVDPVTVPTSAPYPNPNKVNDPAHPFLQPYQRVMPYPTPDAPWQVDITPQVQPVPTPDPLKNPPIPDPKAPPNPNPDPKPDPEPTPQPPPPQPDLCEKYPDIAACQKPKPEEKQDFKDTDLGDLPKLYTKKFPDGLSGVWQARSAQLTASPLVSLLRNLMPQVQGGGSPPQILVPLDVGIYDFGVADLSPPLYVWQFGGLVIVISALLLARALVFGG